MYGTPERLEPEPRASVDLPLPAAPSMATTTRGVHTASRATPRARMVRDEPGEAHVRGLDTVDLATGRAPPSAATAIAIAMRWSPPRAGPPAVEAAARDHQVVPFVARRHRRVPGCPSRSRAAGRSPSREVRPPPGTRNRTLRATASAARTGTSSIIRGSSPRLDPDRSDPGTRFDLDRTRPAPRARSRSIAARRVDAHPIHDLEEVQPARVEADVLDRDAGPGQRGGRDQERGRGRSPGTRRVEAVVLIPARRGCRSRRS